MSRFNKIDTDKHTKTQHGERVAVRCRRTLKKCESERDEDERGGCLCGGELEQVEFICRADINCLFHCD